MDLSNIFVAGQHRNAKRSLPQSSDRGGYQSVGGSCEANRTWLDYVRKYDIDVGADLMFWMGMVAL